VITVLLDHGARTMSSLAHPPAPGLHLRDARREGPPPQAAIETEAPEDHWTCAPVGAGRVAFVGRSGRLLITPEHERVLCNLVSRLQMQCGEGGTWLGRWREPDAGFFPTEIEIAWLDADWDPHFVIEYFDDLCGDVLVNLQVTRGDTLIADAAEAHVEWAEHLHECDVTPAEQYKRVLGERAPSGT